MQDMWVLHHNDIPMSEWEPWNALLEKISPYKGEHSWLMYARLNGMSLVLASIQGRIEVHACKELPDIVQFKRMTNIDQLKGVAFKKFIQTST